MNQIRTSRAAEHASLAETLSRTPGLHKIATKSGESTYLVTFDGADDPMNPQNWPWKKKIATAFAYGVTCLASTFTSAILSPATTQISSRFGISNEVSTLSTSTLFLLGYVAGPFAWAPIAESRGRRLPMIVSTFAFICLGAMSATAKDYQTLALTRFFQGAMGSCPITITTAGYADIFNVYHRGFATTAFACTVFSGPMIASPIGGFTVMNSGLGWRWCCWWGVFFGVASLILLVFVANESYAPYILKQKAVRLRVSTGEWAIHAKLEERHLPIKQLVYMLVKRPFQMLFHEPILALISIYTAFVYALLYTFLISYSIVFVEGYHFNPGLSGLTLMGLVVGLLTAAAANIWQQRYYTRWVRANNGIMIPEWRMPICMTGAVAFPIGLFWFAWTANYPTHVHWAVPAVSGIATGYGLLMIFMCCFTYLIDVYKTNSASAFGAATIVRSGLAAGFPMFATQMFHNMGVEWANTLLALIALILVPVPVVFYLYGAKIRAKSSFALDDASPAPKENAEKPTPGEVDQDKETELERQLSGESNWLGETTSRLDQYISTRSNDRWLVDPETAAARTEEASWTASDQARRASLMRNLGSRSSNSTAVVEV